MSPYLQTILRAVGLLLHVPGLMVPPTLLVCWYFGERYAYGPFIATALLSVGLGQLFYHGCRRAEEARLHHGMVVAAVGWLLVPLLGAIPIWWVAHRLEAGTPSLPYTIQAFTNVWNALFESLSGFTGTGLTVTLREDELPRCLQWWRTFAEWVGGVGVIVLMLSILRGVMGASQLYLSEAREEKILPSVTSTVRMIWGLYLGFTAVSIALLRLAGMPWWEALNHGMTGIATGGFSVTEGSIAVYGPAVRICLLFVMVAGAMSFALHYRVVVQRQVSALWKDAQVRSFGIVLGVGLVFLVAENVWYLGDFLLLDSLFQWTSALTTTGFQTVALVDWSPTGKLLLSLAMIIGGVAGSTCGGIKQLRLVTLVRGLRWRFQRIRLTRHEVMRFRMDEEKLTEAEADRLVRAAGVLAALWAALLWAGILFLLHFVPDGYTLSDVILEVASAESNVGLSTGLTHPGLLWPAKLALIVIMWMGRLEIMPVLILFLAPGPRAPEARQERGA